MIRFSHRVIFVRFLMLLQLFSSLLHAGTSVATVFNPCVTPTDLPSPLLRPPPSCFPLVKIIISQPYTPLSLRKHQTFPETKRKGSKYLRTKSTGSWVISFPSNGCANFATVDSTDSTQQLASRIDFFDKMSGNVVCSIFK